MFHAVLLRQLSLFKAVSFMQLVSGSFFQAVFFQAVFFSGNLFHAVRLRQLVKCVWFYAIGFLHLVSAVGFI